jgi:hypothetical protein
MSKKFIPNGDVDFKTMADSFARTIGRDPGAFAVSADDAAALTAAQQAFDDAFQQARFGGRSKATIAQKEATRATLETIIRRIANAVRNNPSLDEPALILLNVGRRAKAGKVLTVPNESPRLVFVRAIHDACMVPQHELKFFSVDRKPKPPGATRLELFVDLIRPDEKVPEHPGVTAAGRPFYLRSYARSPIRLTPPLANEPMRVIYWARWADAAGNVGPFSATAVGWIEGGSHHLMGPGLREQDRPQIIDVSRKRIEDERQGMVIVALMQTQPRSLPSPVNEEEECSEELERNEAA